MQTRHFIGVFMLLVNGLIIKIMLIMDLNGGEKLGFSYITTENYPLQRPYKITMPLVLVMDYPLQIRQQLHYQFLMKLELSTN